MKTMTRTGYVITGTTVAALLLGGGIAVAFWTTSGTGQGSAAAGTTTNVTITQTAPISNLYPDGPGAPIEVDIYNPDDSDVTITSVTAAVTDTGAVGCTAADFAISGNVWDGGTIAGGATVSASGAELSMIDTGLDQDACKGALVTLTYTAS